MIHCLFAIVCIAFCGRLAAVEGSVPPLTIAYNNKPPFFYTENGQAKGLVVAQARKILERAGIPYRLEEQPFLRILATLKAKTPHFVGLGFSRTEEREQFVIYSAPIYQDQPPLLIYRAHDGAIFRRFNRFEQLIRESQLVFGGKTGNAYPIDQTLKRIPQRDIRFIGEANDLPKLLLRGRFDFMLLYPEEYDYLLKQGHYNQQEIASIRYPDLPPGDYRYFLFSQAVPASTINKINEAIHATKTNIP